MAEFKKVYRNGTIESTLIFRGIEFIETMGEWKNGVRKSNDKCIETQIKEQFSDDEDMEDIKTALEILDTDSDDEIEEGLERLSDFE